MFNIGSGEIAVIAIVALLILGPKRLPELARGIGKFVREFRRQTDEVRGVVEREFYRMDQAEPPPTIAPADGAQPLLGQANKPLEANTPLAPPLNAQRYGTGTPPDSDDGTADTLLPASTEPAVRSQLTAGMPEPQPEPPAVQPVTPSPVADSAVPPPEKQ